MEINKRDLRGLLQNIYGFLHHSGSICFYITSIREEYIDDFAKKISKIRDKIYSANKEMSNLIDELNLLIEKDNK